MIFNLQPHTRPSWISIIYTDLSRSTPANIPARGISPGSYFAPTDRGCITSTPKSVNFSKKSEKWPKYERDSCIPGPIFAERPYLATPKPEFSGPIFGLIFVFLGCWWGEYASMCCPSNTTTHMCLRPSSYSHSTQPTLGKLQHYYTLISNTIHTNH